MGPVRSLWNVKDPLPVEQWNGGELLAMRGWRLVRWCDDGEVRLQSMTRDAVWHGPVYESDYTPFAAPNCGSGVYAIKPRFRPGVSVMDLAVGGSGSDWLSGTNAWIWGWIALYGQVVEHDFGYRAQRAVVRRLHLGVRAHLACRSPRMLARLIDDLEQRYQCPVRPGCWETRKAFRVRGLRSPTGSALVRIPIAWPTAARPAPPPVFAAPAPGPAAISAPASAAPAAQAAIAAPQPAASITPRAAARAGPQAPAPKGEAVVKAFQRAERELGTSWPLKGKGHCPRATLRSWYSRIVRVATSCWQRFTPHMSGFRLILFPLAVVRRAARLLRVRPQTLIAKEY